MINFLKGILIALHIVSAPVSIQPAVQPVIQAPIVQVSSQTAPIVQPVAQTPVKVIKPVAVAASVQPIVPITPPVATQTPTVPVLPAVSPVLTPDQLAQIEKNAAAENEIEEEKALNAQEQANYQELIAQQEEVTQQQVQQQNQENTQIQQISQEQSICNNVDSDIRKEITEAGGMATESQVDEMVQSRKQALGCFNVIQPSQVPTAICNDGTDSYSQNRSGTCSDHGGVDIWEN